MNSYKSQSEVRIEINCILNKLGYTATEFERTLRNRGIFKPLIDVILSHPPALRFYIRKLQIKPKKGAN